MAETKGPEPAHEVHTPDHSTMNEPTGVLELPNSWKYRSFKIFGKKIPWYASPPTQLVLVSFVCFMCPGMFNALNGMGGGGQLGKDASANSKANTALYSTFAVVGFFAGTFTNKLGIRTALSFGGIGYSVYVASYLSYNHTKNVGFTTFSWCVRRHSVVCPGRHHDVLSPGGVQGTIYFLVLDDFQPRSRHW
jgi:hypothetical protein